MGLTPGAAARAPAKVAGAASAMTTSGGPDHPSGAWAALSGAGSGYLELLAQSASAPVRALLARICWLRRRAFVGYLPMRADEAR
jgi:hypothetical protein